MTRKFSTETMIDGTIWPPGDWSLIGGGTDQIGRPIVYIPTFVEGFGG